MRSFPDVQAEVCAQRLEAANARIAALEAENARLKAIIQRYMNTYPAFRMKPIGAPHRIATQRIASPRQSAHRTATHRIAPQVGASRRSATQRNAPLRTQ